MCSTFKWALAGAILQRAEQGQLRLEQPIPFGASDLQQWAPVTRARLSEGKLTVEELCFAAVTVSDNTATNLLLDRIGGPAGLTAFFRELGDEVTRLDRDEPMLNLNAVGDPRDTTSPRAMAQSLRAALTTSILSETSRKMLTEWLLATTTGARRIAAGLSPMVKWGHKTGTGNRGAVNDVGVIWTESGRPCYVAVYLSGSDRPLAELEAAHAQIGSVIEARLVNIAEH